MASSPGSDFPARLEALCPAYRQFLDQHETDTFLSDIVFLYGRNTIEEANTTHEVATWRPEHVSIGNDSGDHEFLLRLDGSGTVVRQDPGSFSTPTLETVHASFPQWLADGCPLPEEPSHPIPLDGRIWLLAAPPGGINEMFALKKMLATNWSIPQMKQSMTSPPALLIDQGMPYAIHRRLRKHPALRPLLGFSLPGSEAILPYTDL